MEHGARSFMDVIGDCYSKQVDLIKYSTVFFQPFIYSVVNFEGTLYFPEFQEQVRRGAVLKYEVRSLIFMRCDDTDFPWSFLTVVYKWKHP